jgi:hypothetical protein
MGTFAHPRPAQNGRTRGHLNETFAAEPGPVLGVGTGVVFGVVSVFRDLRISDRQEGSQRIIHDNVRHCLDGTLVVRFTQRGPHGHFLPGPSGNNAVRLSQALRSRVQRRPDKGVGQRLQQGQSILNEIPGDIENEPSHALVVTRWGALRRF